MELWREELVNAKYHFAVAKRLHDNYFEFLEKRFLVGVINELAKSAVSIVRATLQYGGNGLKGKKNLAEFVRIAPNYFEKESIVNLLRILEIEKAQKNSPIEFSKNGTIILLIQNKYVFLKLNRFKDFVDSIDSMLFSIKKLFEIVD
ncbi:hypothetical protein HN604_00515 [archaeon]|jgi:hypothetical protein|nr:hypothetical protein [archaeon]MBT6182979.1 hypothetical protein [archaeon]MBT6606636.1 hypothetical protein [archaeon]MBT7251879.1 hypothetical protein [archaeon]MBT7660549.1 hypothetical protein [archaeon]